MADEHLQHLMMLIEAKQVYTSYALLKKIPADTYIPGKQKILDELRDALIKGKAIHAILQNSRNNGDYPAALRQALKLQKIVPDYPNLKQDIAAITTTLKKLETTINLAKIAASHGRKKEVITLLQTVRQIDAEHAEIAIIEKTVRRKAQSKSAKSIIFSVLILVLPCLLFGTEKLMIWKAQENLDNATVQIKSNQFKQAKKSIAKMHGNLRFIYVFNKIKKDNLMARATSLQSSMIFVQGMRGRVVHDGEFISSKEKNIMSTLEKLLLEAARSRENKEWQEALNSYNKALEFIQQHEDLVGSEQTVIIEKIAAIEAQQEGEANQLTTEECTNMISLAQVAYGQQDWPLAIEKYKEAFAFAEAGGVNESCVDEQSRAQYNSSIITILLQKGDELQNNNKPSRAVDYYLQASDYATAQNMDEETIAGIQIRIDSLKEQVFMARVRLLIREGDSLIKQGDFSAGLSKYNFALTMLEGNGELILGKDKLISSLTEKIGQTERTAAITAHTAHLESTGQSNLRKFFDLSPQDKLTEITISLLEQQDNLFTYRISAKSIRDKVKYELLYQFNENTGKWKMVK